MCLFMNIPYFSLGITVESFFGLNFRYLCCVLYRHRRQPATQAFHYTLMEHSEVLYISFD